MASMLRATTVAIIASAGFTLTGCAGDGGGYNMNMFGATTTASIPEKPAVDPACVSLTSQIDTLKKEGVADKIEKAAAKKYKMTQADLTKAAQLNKATADFQARCSSLTPAQATGTVRPQGEATAQTAPTQTIAAAPAMPAVSGGE